MLIVALTVLILTINSIYVQREFRQEYPHMRYYTFIILIIATITYCYNYEEEYYSPRLYIFLMCVGNFSLLESDKPCLQQNTSLVLLSLDALIPLADHDQMKILTFGLTILAVGLLCKEGASAPIKFAAIYAIMANINYIEKCVEYLALKKLDDPSFVTQYNSRLFGYDNDIIAGFISATVFRYDCEERRMHIFGLTIAITILAMLVLPQKMTPLGLYESLYKLELEA